MITAFDWLNAFSFFIGRTSHDEHAYGQLSGLHLCTTCKEICLTFYLKNVVIFNKYHM